MAQAFLNTVTTFTLVKNLMASSPLITNRAFAGSLTKRNVLLNTTEKINASEKCHWKQWAI